MTTSISATIHMIDNFEVRIQELANCSTVTIGPDWLGSSDLCIFLKTNEEVAIVEKAFLTVKGIRQAAELDKEAAAYLPADQARLGVANIPRRVYCEDATNKERRP